MNKDTLYSMDPTLKFSPVVKDRLFYDRFRYCIAFDLEEASALKQLDHDYVDRIINRRIEWRQMSMQRWMRAASTINVLARRHNEITPEIHANLHTFVDHLLNSSAEYKLVTSVNSGWVYTSDSDLAQSLSSLPFLINQRATEAIVDRPKNTIRLKKPQHRLRSYWRSIKLTDQEKINLRNFFANQPDIRPSPGLRDWFACPYHRTQDYFFMDYNDDAWVTMLSLIRPGLIRKTSQLID